MIKKKIYIGEDDPVMGKLISMALMEREDMEGTLFSDGMELYKKVREAPPDGLILDIIMPSMNGLAITRLLKFHDHYAHIPIIVMTTITDPNIKSQAMDAGADKLFLKPFDTDELINEMAGRL